MRSSTLASTPSSTPNFRSTLPSTLPSYFLDFPISLFCSRPPPQWVVLGGGQKVDVLFLSWACKICDSEMQCFCGTSHNTPAKGITEIHFGAPTMVIWGGMLRSSAFLLTVGAFLLTILAFLLAIGAFWLQWESGV